MACNKDRNLNRSITVTRIYAKKTERERYIDRERAFIVPAVLVHLSRVPGFSSDSAPSRSVLNCVGGDRSSYERVLVSLPPLIFGRRSVKKEIYSLLVLEGPRLCMD